MPPTLHLSSWSLTASCKRMTFMWQVDKRSVALCLRDCLSVLLDAFFARTAGPDSQISLDVAGMM